MAPLVPVVLRVLLIESWTKVKRTRTIGVKRVSMNVSIELMLLMKGAVPRCILRTLLRQIWTRLEAFEVLLLLVQILRLLLLALGMAIPLL